MQSAFSFIVADLLKRNMALHEEKMLEIGMVAEWPKQAFKICQKELRANPLPPIIKANLVGFSGLMWGQIKGKVDTVFISQLIIQWMLELKEMDLYIDYTEAYKDLLQEFVDTIDAGAEGKVENINKDLIVASWEFVKEKYLSELHVLAEERIKEIFNN